MIKRSNFSKTDGFTLVELLVALVLGLVILGGVLSIFSETRQSFRVNENLARVQENARFSFEVLAREIREAGSTPCGTRAMASVVRVAGATPWYADWAAGTVRGFDGAQDTTDLAGFGTVAGDRVAGTDAIISLRNVSDEASIRTVTSHDTPGNLFVVQPNPTTYYGPADLLSVCDGKSGAIVQVGNVGATPPRIDYDFGSLNCRETAALPVKLGYPTGACAAATPAKTFADGAIITKYDPVFWYIGINNRTGRSLYRLHIFAKTVSGVTVTTAERQEMIPSIQDMQIEYLVRDSAAGNALATTWIPASDATFNAASGGWGETNTKQVVATRIALTLVSEEKVGTTGQVLQRQFISVSALRSRDIP